MQRAIRDYLARSLKYALPTLLLALPLLPAYGLVAPWPTGDRAIGEHPGQTLVAVGYAGKTRYFLEDGGGWKTDGARSRDYILAPSFLTSPVLYEVRQTNDGVPAVSQSDARPVLLALALAYLIGAGSVGWFWILPRIRPPVAAEWSASGSPWG